MKKLTLVILSLLVAGTVYAAPISTTRYLSADDVTYTNLDTNTQTITNAINSFDGSRLQTGSVSADALTTSINPQTRWDEAFNDFVVTGLLPPTSASLASTTTAGTAYVNGYRVAKDATAHTYTASKHTYLDLSNTGVYTYQEVAILAAEPSVTANSIRLALVSTDATTVQLVTDKRTTSINIATAEDFWRSGYKLTFASPDSIVISPGRIKVSSTLVSDDAHTTLTLGTATDWAGGVSGRATSTLGYVGIDVNGNIKMFTTAPAYSDYSMNTSGRKRYSLVSGTLYRIIGWFYMNATGSGEIDYCAGNFKDGNVRNIWAFTASDDTSTASTGYVTLSRMTADFYTSGDPVLISFQGEFNDSGAGATTYLTLDIDGTKKDYAAATTSLGGNMFASIPILYKDILTAGKHTIGVGWKITGGTAYQSAGTADRGKRTLMIEEY